MIRKGQVTAHQGRQGIGQRRLHTLAQGLQTWIHHPQS